MTPDDQSLIEQARRVSMDHVALQHGLKLRRSGHERIGPCPKCGGTDRFSYNPSKGVFNCRKCGATGDVIAFEMFLDGSSFAEAITKLAGQQGGKGNGQHRPNLGRIVARYRYDDENGAMLFEVVRFEPKTFRQRRPDGNDGWIWNLHGVRIVPYRLVELNEALAMERLVFVPEGEKDVENLISRGAPATCNPGGAGKWPRCNIDEYFRGAIVVIIADHDPQATNSKGGLLTHPDGRPVFVGWDHAIEVAKHLEPIAKSVRVIDLKALWNQCPDKCDISDWFEAGGTLDLLYTFAESVPLFDPGYVAKPSTSQRRLIMTSGEFVRAFVPPDYLIDGVLQMSFLYALTGKTGSGKTAIALLFAASVALGRNIGDIEVQQGRVLYFAGENYVDVQMRWIAMAQHMGFDPEAIEVYFISQRFKISQTREIIAAEIKRFGEVSLVVVDTSAAYYEGKEVNSNTEQAAHATMMRGLIALPGGPTVLVNCHPVKNASNDNLIPLGAGAFLNELDGNLTCVVDFPAIEIHWQGKFRGPDFDALTFRLETATHERLITKKGKLIPTVVAKYLSEAARDEIQKANLSDRQRLVAEIAKDGKASVAEYAARCGFLLGTGLPNKRKTHTMIGALKRKKIVTGEPGDYSVPKPRKSGTINGTVEDQIDNPVPRPERSGTRWNDDGKND